MKLIEVEGGTLEEREQVYDLVESGARGPQGEKGDPGEGGGIDYTSPIAITADGTITPSNGEFYTVDAKTAELSGTAGEEFKPADQALTSVRIAGVNTGVDLRTININTSSLGPGEQFEIAVDNGESAKMRKDSACDLIRTGNGRVPMKFSIKLDSDQINIAKQTWTTVQLDNALFDPSGLFDLGTWEFTPIRDAYWTITSRFPVQMASGGAIKRVICRLLIDNAIDASIFGDVWPDESNTTNSPVRTTGSLLKELFNGNTAVKLQIYIDGSGATTGIIKGDANEKGEANLSGVEVPKW
jgi:hypothetical protein